MKRHAVALSGKRAAHKKQKRLLRFLLIGVITTLLSMGSATETRAQTSSFTIVVREYVEGAPPGSGPLITDFSFLVNEDNTGDPTDPDFNNRPGIKPMASHSPIVAAGDATSASVTLPDGRYLITTRSPGYKLWGKHIRLPDDSGTVLIEMLKEPLPLAQLQISVFRDVQSVNAVPGATEVDELESGLGGFRIILEDRVGEVTVDYFGDPLCGGECLTDPNGELIIKNLAPNKYTIHAIPPDGSGWIQTSTFEGKREVDSWLTEGDDGFGAIGEARIEPIALPTAFWFGFVKECNFGNTSDTCLTNDVAGTGTITGRARTWIGWPPFDNLVFGEPVIRPWVALSNFSGNDEQVYTGRGNADGTFTIPNVPPGVYGMAIWDEPLDYIIRFTTVEVSPGETVNLGDVGVSRWFGWVSGYVFMDNGIAANGTNLGAAANENGIRDCVNPANAATCERGIANQELVIRHRDGSIKAATFTNAQGYYEFPEEISKLFKMNVLEVGFARFHRTGHSVHDEIRVNLPDSDHDNDGTPNSLDPDLPGVTVIPQDLGGGLLLNQLTLESHRSVVDFGKRPYVGVENGGISGVVIYGTTRNEFEARLAAGEDYEPGIPSVTMRLWQATCTNPDDPLTCTKGLLLNELQTDEWSHPRADHADLSQSCDIRDANGEPVAEPFPPVSFNCVEVAMLSNETKAGAFDGGYAFESMCPGGWPCAEAEEVPLPPAEYIVEVVPPEFYQIVKEEDQNTDEGSDFVPAIPPPPCAGPLHFVNDLRNPFHGQMMPLCNMRLVTVQAQQNAAADFFLFTNNPNDADGRWTTSESVPPPGRVFGLVADDVHFDLDPRSIWFGEERGIPNIPIGIRDYTGRLITTVTTSEHGFYEALLPSTQIVDCPTPAGVCPGMYIFVINDPGDPSNPNLNYNPNYLTEPLAFDLWPGLMTPLDTPLDPISGVTCSLMGAVGDAEPPIIPLPEFFNVSQPYLNAGDTTTVITIKGASFGTATGSVTLGDIALNVQSWDIEQIQVTVPATVPPGRHQFLVTTADNVSIRNGLTFHVLGTGYNPPLVFVDPSVDVGDRVVQAAIDAAAPGSLILVRPGTYRENVILHKRVQLQGYGPGGLVGTNVLDIAPDDPRVHIPGTVINGKFFPVTPAIQDDWDALLASLTFGNPPGPGDTTVPRGAGITVVADDGEFTVEDPARIDGFGVTGGRGEGAGGIHVHAYARYLHITNNILEGNGSQYAGGAIALGRPERGDSQNDGIVMRYNRIMGNGSIHRAGAVGIFSGAENYLFEKNEVCANFSGEYGGGISHFGLSPGGRIFDNIIYYNEAFDEGGGILIASEPPLGSDPDGLGNGSGAVSIERNLIHSNLSNDDGGGIRLLDPLSHRITIVNNMIIGNLATDFGGAIAVDDASNLVIVNNTIAFNMSTDTAEDSDGNPNGAGMVSERHSAAFQATLPPGSPQYSDPVAFFNNIFYWNEAFTFDPTAVDDPEGVVTTTGGLVSHGCIDLEVIGTVTPQFFSPRFSILTLPYGTPHPSNIVADDCGPGEFNEPNFNFPEFVLVHNIELDLVASRVDPAVRTVRLNADPRPLGHNGLPGNYHVTTLSPAIDAGTPALGGVNAPCDDYDRDGRPQAAGFDIGADEQPGSEPCLVSTELLFFSTQANNALPGVAGPYDNADLYTWNGTSFARSFDASVAGLPPSANLDAISIVDHDTFYFSMDRDSINVPTIGSVNDEDVVLYDAGTWSLFFDGSDVGLTTNGEDVDAFEILSPSTILISTLGPVQVSGLRGTYRDEDILKCEGSFGPSTSCTWSVYFDGSDIGLVGGNREIGGLDVDASSNLYLQIKGSANLSGLSVDRRDVIICNSPTTGPNSACASFTKYFDASDAGLSAPIDAIDIP